MEPQSNVLSHEGYQKVVSWLRSTMVFRIDEHTRYTLYFICLVQSISQKVHHLCSDAFILFASERGKNT